MTIYFDLLHLYYFPQYLPVMQRLSQQECDLHLVCYNKHFPHAHEIPNVTLHFVDNNEQAKELYLKTKPSWVVFGNACDFADELHEHSKTALMQHGIGPKACYYTVSASDIQVRFVEGSYRKNRLQELFPNKIFIDTGYAKLDPIVNQEEKGLDLAALGLDPDKPTLLYAPTFYPSSIENMAKEWPNEFKQYNILLKPHFFSLEKEKYRKQKQRLEHWAKFDNVYLASRDETNLLPFMASADLMISDASSAIFEFVALNKPVVWCDFYYLRWGYRGPFRYRFEKRMDKDLYAYADVAAHAQKYKNLREVVESKLSSPTNFESKRLKLTEELAGKVDGQCSQRIADYLMSH